MTALVGGIMDHRARMMALSRLLLWQADLQQLWLLYPHMHAHVRCASYGCIGGCVRGS